MGFAPANVCEASRRVPLLLDRRRRRRLLSRHGVQQALRQRHVELSIRLHQGSRAITSGKARVPDSLDGERTFLNVGRRQGHQREECAEEDE